MLPFIFADTRMIPAGVRAIGSALLDAGFDKTRIVLQQWNRNFRPSQMRLDGRIPDVFMVSSMSLHSEECMELIRDAHRIDLAHRPLIIAGGPHAVYEPYDLFSANPARAGSADVVVTGEEFVLLSLIEAVLSMRGRAESMRSAFVRARDSRALDDVPGLVYSRGDKNGVPEELVDTGIQRLVGDLDELPHPVLGYRILEPPGQRATLSASAMPIDQVRQRSPISSLVLTFGCKFACPYCPIPAYNQRQYRVKSGERIADEMFRLNKEYGLRYFFGADDNFFNDKARTLDIVEKLARAEFDGMRLRSRARWATEVTVHDTLQMKDHLPLIRESGCRALWLGVEDLTATLVKKGQSADKTTEAFRALRHLDYRPAYACFRRAMSDLLHLEDRLHDPLRLLGSGSVISLGTTDGTICHDRPNLSFSQPHWLSCAARGELVPQLVDLLLRLAVHDEGDRLRELEVRPAVQGDELLPSSWNLTIMTDPLGPGPASPYRATSRIFEFLKIEM